MSSGNLIPDRQLTFSPELARTIGLEEAVLLQELGENLKDQPRWTPISISRLCENLPFWSNDQIVNLCQKLIELGILAQSPSDRSDTLLLAISKKNVAEDVPTPAHLWSQSSDKEVTSIPASEVKVNTQLLDFLTLNHGIPRGFCLEALSNFSPLSNRKDYEAQCRRYVLARWRREQEHIPSFEIREPPAFNKNWRPNQDALEILDQGGIDQHFAENCRAEFILYWTERGGPPREVNSRFVEHVRRRWQRHTSQLHHSTEPTRIQRDWQPDSSVYETLKLSGITETDAIALLPEFIMYWVDSNQMHTSWNSKFLQHVKRHCRGAKFGVGNDESKKRGGDGKGNRSKDQSLVEDLTDTSWAT